MGRASVKIAVSLSRVSTKVPAQYDNSQLANHFHHNINCAKTASQFVQMMSPCIQSANFLTDSRGFLVFGQAS
jgi:hypothetical protein